MLSKRQRSQLDKIIKQVEKIITQADAAESRRQKKRKVRQSRSKLPRKGAGRIRRSHADSKKMKREIKAARKRGVKVADLATKYGVSSAYIYMMK